MRNAPHSWSIRGLLALLLGCVCVPSILAIAFFFRHEYEVAVGQARTLALNTAKLVAAQQKLLERNVETVLTVLSKLPAVTGRDTAGAEALFREALVPHPAIANLLQMDETGRIVASARPRAGSVSVADRRFFRGIRETRAFSAGEFAVGRVVQAPSFHFALPLERSGTFSGGLVAQVSLTKLDDLFHHVSLPEESRLLLVDHAGLRLHHSPPRESSPLGQPAIPSLIRAIDSSPEDSEVLVDHDQLGLKVIYGLVRLRLTPSAPPYMAVVAGIPHPTVVDSIKAENLGPLVILLASFLLAFLAARFISTRLIGAGLELLAATTRRLAAGELAVRSGVRGGCAEVQALALAFDAMAESLAEAKLMRDRVEEEITQKERRLTEALAWKETILDNTAMGVLAVTRNRIITEVNNKLLEIFGYSQEELLGASVSVLHVSPADSAAFGERYWAGTATGEVVSVEWPMRRKNGEVFWAELAGRAVNPRDLEQGVVWVILDIDERRKAEAQILEMKDRAEAASRAKSEFLANMSHEVRTPLNGILGMLQLMQTTCLDAEQGNYADLAIQSGCRLNGLLTDILDLSKVEAGKMSLVTQPFRLEDVFRTVSHLFQPVALQNGVHLGFTIDSALPDTLLGDSTRIQQVLSNLVGNALKFTAQGYVQVGAKPLLPARDGRTRVLFWVEDSGAGIADETLAILFEPFSQGDGRLTRRHQGAGLGLAICKRLVALMEGDIAVDTELGAGSTFCFTATFGHAQAQAPEQPGAEPGPDRTWTEPLRILLAEDDEVNALTVQRALEKAGHRVVLAGDGKACLEALAAEDFDVVLMDIMMPIMDGMAAARAIRDPARFGEKSRVPIIALTAHAMLGDREKFLAAGMDGYLAKPLVLEEVRQAVARAGADRRR